MWGVAEIAVCVILLAAVCAVVVIALRGMGIALPQWFWHILGVVVLAVVAVIAVRVIVGAWGHSP